ncbi:helicase SKI2W isoform X2 [Lingula anatina]|uniref:Helicase SKI2W isoform X2 n=1 Tax=Lingula anatina TaxID=7574 RepID=A0A1S3K3W1_LINAN|nr:helicase SKI2W isoform X2 [Lingula anatina]|eukprot:XP_013417315.1 helicase SKI2W isoform X2 [Lingula anatina]
MSAMAGQVVDGIDIDGLSILSVGTCNNFDVIERRKSSDTSLPLETLPLGLPPVLPTLKADLEEYLSHPEKLPVYDIERTQRFFSSKGCPDNLYLAEPTPVQTTIRVDRDMTTGQLLGYKEEFLDDTGSSAKNSTSLSRPPGPPSEGIKGNSTNYPFWPGGLEEPVFTDLAADNLTQIDFETDLLSCPPGFDHGIVFECKSRTENPEGTLQKEASQTPNLLKLSDILEADDLDFSVGEEEEEEDKEKEGADKDKNSADIQDLPRSESFENLVTNTDSDLGDVVTRQQEEPLENWAIPIDLTDPVSDFHKRIPEMACTWPFEPDIFQKQAILRLEQGESVFVAAHTSAGKTVVAEYAIALSMKHMTRTIYTSPIKALSNQKFRDFKQRFSNEGDVGLVTGDVQIHPEASCLIMTTEILRSMLYNGSDVVRDLEWVIFDEVHYINDPERGVVWEEVLIMLPHHVNIILLSATVPNTREFAGWVGRTKKKKMYVISTPKRPVPLEHFLFTGNSNKTSHELFLLQDAKGNFLTKGYYQAIEAKKERTSKSSQSFGPKGARGGNPAQDKNVWLSVIDMLKKKDKLPAVAFTFSKKKIEDNASNLSSVDLTTQSEKSEIHIFFQKSIAKLKGSDKTLPQVLHMQDILKRGIGIHHSGILPILKEVVEMCFQRGLVKVLFATETFAMGVNMPARTVIFDSIRKHDGTAFRDLLPGEYIQMAGRAGRRGLDATGTVMILCKGDVPEMADLHKMMLGKPTLLQSQFRLTYSMILNLLRVEQLRIEDMMKRSFSEFHSQKSTTERKKTMADLQEKMSTMQDLDCNVCCIDLEGYYKACREYCITKTELQKKVLTHPAAIKALSPGRVVIVDTELYQNTLATVLKSTLGQNNERMFTCLVICEKNASSADSASNATKTVEGPLIKPVLVNQVLFQPEGPSGHVIVDLTAEHIGAISNVALKVNADRILEDFKKRQIARFKNDPPGQSVVTTTQELLRLAESDPHGLPSLDPVKDFGLRDIDLVEQFRRLQFLQEELKNFACVTCSNFRKHFEEKHNYMRLKEEYAHLQFLLSDESLTLLPEYQQRVQVLRALKYIDNTNTVQLKGRVACELGNQEIIITELVFENILTDLHPTEIAALLSCVVFEQKRCSEPSLTPDLQKGKDLILKIATSIGETQRACGLLTPVDEIVESLKFGLTEVVFEWARGMPFSEITGLTDVQEGIIVRCIQRLDETLKDVRNAARIIGDPVLYRKMEEASKLIKRDIVFAASLYIQ